MTTFASHLDQAFDTAIEQLDGFIDRLTRTAPHLTIGLDNTQEPAPWSVIDKANGSETIGRFATYQDAERFARAHAARSSGTLDYLSFRPVGA